MSKSEILIGYTDPAADAKSQKTISLNLKRANRHGLIAGATGTGKTVTLQALSESFSEQGCPGVSL